ncbi:hypothetical protein PROFUN_06119 [Planoprotostelium fungivorum]|uniref:Uncharacterized protein n=1 Tax=Planoprotostelium fungivorum TaxID=1890364 RepID=A0A2P6NPG4_9EUKA|nr:hypothetical protein PROFUN_06119 [Planoprotostelium fungivorum]
MQTQSTEGNEVFRLFASDPHSPTKSPSQSPSRMSKTLVTSPAFKRPSGVPQRRVPKTSPQRNHFSGADPSPRRLIRYLTADSPVTPATPNQDDGGKTNTSSTPMDISSATSQTISQLNDLTASIEQKYYSSVETESNIRALLSELASRDNKQAKETEKLRSLLNDIRNEKEQLSSMMEEQAQRAKPKKKVETLLDDFEFRMEELRRKTQSLTPEDDREWNAASLSLLFAALFLFTFLIIGGIQSHHNPFSTPAFLDPSSIVRPH